MSVESSGPLIWLTNQIDERLAVRGHHHRRDHVTMVIAGWMLVLTQDGSEAGKVVQLAHHLYRPPPGAPIPVRFGNWPGTMGEELDIRFFEPGEPIPLDGEVIPFAPVADHALIPAGVQHHTHTLSLDPVAIYRCVFVRVEGDDADL